MIVSSREWSQHQHWWNLRTKWQRIWTWAPSFSGQVLYWWSSLTPVWTYNAHTYTIHMYPPCKKHIHLISIWVFSGFFYTEWKVILINQRTTLLNLMSSTILGFKPSLCSLVRKYFTVPPLLYHDESTLTKNTCRLFQIFKSNVACPYPPPPNQPKNKKKLVIYDKGMLIQQLMFLNYSNYKTNNWHSSLLQN